MSPIRLDGALSHGYSPSALAEGEYNSSMMGRRSSAAHGQLIEALEASEGDADVFVEILRDEAIQHLSFSQITTVEFCEQRYQLQYIEMQELEPTPTYFIKGKAMHELIAETYRGMQNGNGSTTPVPNGHIPDEMDLENKKPQTNTILTLLSMGITQSSSL